MRPKHETITQEELKRHLSYNKETGLFTWLTTTNVNNHKKGKAAGSTQHGYVTIALLGIRHRAHRLAWLYVYGYFPENFIDHINRVKDDNRIVNLREVTKSCNLRNSGNRKDSFSGVKGVTRSSSSGKWISIISVNGKRIQIGSCSDDFVEAVAKRLAIEDCLDWGRCDVLSPARAYMNKYINKRQKDSKC